MDIEKHLNRLELYFMIPSIAGFLLIFTFGLTFFSTDPEAQWYQLIILLLIPSSYLIAGLLIKKQNRFVWIYATLLAFVLIIHAGIKIFGGFTSMLASYAALAEIVLGLIMALHLLRNDIGRYYWG